MTAITQPGGAIPTITNPSGKHLAPFDTAIFIDLENLLCGYALTEQETQDLDLEGLHQKIKDLTHIVGRPALSRAYANWQSYKTRPLHAIMNKLNVSQEHVQAVNFSQKNLADIALCTDVMDVLHTRPNIRTFVIVSGDGGFAWLVRRLNEYGKNVVIAAYESQANKVLKDLADEFIGIPDPRGSREQVFKNKDTQLEALLNALGQFDATRASLTDAQDHVRLVFSTLPEIEPIRNSLQAEGIPIQKLEVWLKDLILGFDYHALFGHVKLVEFVKQFTALASSHYLLKQTGSEYKLEFREVPIGLVQEAPQDTRIMVDLSTNTSAPTVSQVMERGHYGAVTDAKEAISLIAKVLEDMTHQPRYDFADGVQSRVVVDYVQQQLTGLRPFSLGANGWLHLISRALPKVDMVLLCTDNPADQGVIAYEDTQLRGHTVKHLPGLNELHSVEHYRNALMDSTGNKWFFVLSSPEVIRMVAEFVLKQRGNNQKLSEWLRKAELELENKKPLATMTPKDRHNAILNTLLAFNASSVYAKTPEVGKLDTQMLLLKTDLISASSIIERLKASCRDKLEKTLGVLPQQEVLNKLF